MGKVTKYYNNIEIFLSSDKGARFFNFAYSIGAAIVIWGALFKILHLPGGNLLLAIGMGTEVLMFILNAFDRPDRSTVIDRIKVDGDIQNSQISKQILLSHDINQNEEAISFPVSPQNNVSFPEILVPDIKSLTTATDHYVTEMEEIAKELKQLRSETERMSQNLARLNSIYAGMISAMNKQ